MSREEFIGKLQMVYVGDRNAFNDIVCAYDSVLSANEKAIEYIKENKRLKETLEEHDETLEKAFNLVAQLSLRIDKAIEYIKQEDWNTEYDYNLLNILQNGSDSQ